MTVKDLFKRFPDFVKDALSINYYYSEERARSIKTNLSEVM
jgi:hypothetical protein